MDLTIKVKLSVFDLIAVKRDISMAIFTAYALTQVLSVFTAEPAPGVATLTIQIAAHLEGHVPDRAAIAMTIQRRAQAGTFITAFRVALSKGYLCHPWGVIKQVTLVPGLLGDLVAIQAFDHAHLVLQQVLGVDLCHQALALAA